MKRLNFYNHSGVNNSSFDVSGNQSHDQFDVIDVIGDFLIDKQFNLNDFEEKMQTLLKAIFFKTTCFGCKHYLVLPYEYCKDCKLYSHLQLQSSVCVICMEPPTIIRKLCKCGQIICAECWCQYRKNEKCPHCCVPYPTLKRKFK